MSLQIVYIKKKNTEGEERILLLAGADLNLNDYAIIDSTYENGAKSNLLRHFYRFPDFTLKKGQYVLLCTGEGEDGTGKYNGVHFCRRVFWGLKKPILNDNQIESIEVLKVETISIKKV